MNDWQSTYLGRGALPRDLSSYLERLESLIETGALEVVNNGETRQVKPNSPSRYHLCQLGVTKVLVPELHDPDGGLTSPLHRGGTILMI
jgi:hypothetical protein